MMPNARPRRQSITPAGGPTPGTAAPAPLNTVWWCDLCRASGVIQHQPHVGVFEIVELLHANHDQTPIAQLNNCHFDPQKVHVELGMTELTMTGRRPSQSARIHA